MTNRLRSLAASRSHGAPIPAGTRDLLEAKMAAIPADIARFFAGEPLANRVGS